MHYSSVYFPGLYAVETIDILLEDFQEEFEDEEEEEEF